MDPAKYEYQSDFAKHYIAVGRKEGKAEGEARGRAEGRASVMLKQVRLRFGDPSSADVARIEQASIDDLDLWAERILSAATLRDVIGD